jgi:dipeptidyl aminopeptidase/acylaminoacyl peptidase
MVRRPVAFFLCLLLPEISAFSAEVPKLLTVAEKSDFKATSKHAEVVDFCEQLAKAAPAVVRLGQLGTTTEGKKLPLVILADPPIASAQEAARSGKPVLFAMGDIHAGEVDGKEALLMLARETALAKERPLLKDFIVVLAPIFNADGNDRMAKTNRPGQVGPVEGMGIRANAQGLDLNRDFIKLESPEVRALVHFFTQWDPAVVVDTHTTNGSHHRYVITYEGPRNPAGDAKVIETVRDVLLPDAGKRLKDQAGYDSFFYGNFSRDHQRWETVPAVPRFGLHYLGLRNRIGVLSESYSYAPYKDRVFASLAFVHGIFDSVAAHKDKYQKLLSAARTETIRAGRDPKDSDQIAVRLKTVPLGKPVTFKGFVEEIEGGRRRATDQPKDYQVEYVGLCVPEKSVRRPYAYLFPATLTKVVENLQHHGLRVEECREDIDLDVEVNQVTKVTHAERAFQNHHIASVTTGARQESRRVSAGTILVRTSQPLGTLAAYLLEPQSEDGLCAWNFFDPELAEGKDYPVLRLLASVPITAGPVRPLAGDRVLNKPITYDAVTRTGLSFNGNPADHYEWLDDGEHFLQVKNGRLYKVEALTGRAKPFHDPEQMAKGLRTIPGLEPETADQWSNLGLSTRPRRRGPAASFQMNPQKTGALFKHDKDLYYCNFDGSHAVRLTKSSGDKELISFSPNGQWIAYVSNHNLYTVDIATQTEHALTKDGNDLISNGKPDWVYGEEIYNYQKVYWWSPDSSQLVFLRVDDHPVHIFTVINQIPSLQNVERTPYPKPGDPNPTVKLGTVAAAGGPVEWVDLSSYQENATLLVHAGWTPDSQQVFFYMQDRAQTWLDFCTAPRHGGSLTRLFRDTTKAWVDNPRDPHFLKDGSFLLPSERTGWKHYYHFDAKGKLLNPVTEGEWEARVLHTVDEAGGWVYLSGTRNNPIGSDLYRARLDGSALERLTAGPGEHRATVSPQGQLFVDAVSTFNSPTQVRLYSTDGKVRRTLDTNPVYALEEYQRGKEELVKIPTPDGFILEGSLLTPPNFDPTKKYPVWFMTYGGPHAPMTSDSWAAGRARDQALAQMGFIVFHADPRSASGKGICSTWTAYRQFGVPELKDIETIIGWVKQKPYVDGNRIGMSGHSYGGFMTSFCLTHSKLFAAGIAGAPVTDWRTYDTIYTERYMNTPQENPQGYDATSVVKAARNLHGRLLLLHGLMDDNVHFQNSVQFIEELQKANKMFEVMVYPRSRHGIFGSHVQLLMVDFMKRHLKPET